MVLPEHPESRSSTPAAPVVRCLRADCEATYKPQWKGLRPIALFERLTLRPRIGNALCALGDAVIDELDRRACELIALRVSAVRDCAYVWLGHCQIALHAGLTVDEITRVAVGPAVFDGRDAAILRAVDDVLGDRRVDAESRCILGDDALSVEVAAGFYGSVVRILEGAEPEPDVAPIPGLETPRRARANHVASAA
jgi:AhpD family alkylhydroperoxidase